MGTWAAGNFDNDAALDMLGAVMDVIDPVITGFMNSDEVGVGDLEEVLACVAIRIALVERCSASPPSKDEAKRLRAKILEIFDRDIDKLRPKPGHKNARRKVIVDTLDGFVRVAKARRAP